MIKYIIAVIFIIALVAPMDASPLYENRSYLIFAEPTVPVPVQAGYVTFMLRAGGAVQDRELFISNQEQHLAFDANYTYELEESTYKNWGWEIIAINPCGTSDPQYLATGNYTAAIRNGNGGHMEIQNFQILPGDNKVVEFLGHAITISGKSKSQPLPSVNDTCSNVQFSYRYDGLNVVYIFDNPNTKDTALRVYPTETYWEHICQEISMMGCFPCIDVQFMRIRTLPVSFPIVPPGHVEIPWYLDRMPDHIRYDFTVETICP